MICKYNSRASVNLAIGKAMQIFWSIRFRQVVLLQLHFYCTSNVYNNFEVNEFSNKFTKDMPFLFRAIFYIAHFADVIIVVNCAVLPCHACDDWQIFLNIETNSFVFSVINLA